MRIAALSVALLMALIVTELIFYIARNSKLKSFWYNLNAVFVHFRRANTEEERQNLLIEMGLKTLSISSIIFFACIFLFVIAFMPLWLFEFDNSEIIIYLFLLTTLTVIFGIFKLNDFSLQSFVNNSKKNSTTNYNAIDRFLHKIVLGSKIVRKISFDIDLFFSKIPDENLEKIISKDAPIYVCGLARSGTTILLNVLDHVEGVASLNYRDMPFVLAPNLWKKLNKLGAREEQLSERAHADGMTIGYNSPEAFEEIFWQTFCEPVNCSSTCYGLSEPSQEALTKFAQYRCQVVYSKHQMVNGNTTPRYLSKNNNNLTRLPTLCKQKTAKILLVYRDPLETARSLLRQHQKFLLSQQEDPFTLQYMKWLGHHEFGLDYKPFCFAVSSQNPNLKPDTVDYWLDYWNAIYLHLLSHQSEQIHLVHHDSMRAEPEIFLTKLFEVLELAADAAALSTDIKPHTTATSEFLQDFLPEIMASAYATYGMLLADSRNIYTTNDKPSYD